MRGNGESARGRGLGGARGGALISASCLHIFFIKKYPPPPIVADEEGEEGDWAALRRAPGPGRGNPPTAVRSVEVAGGEGALPGLADSVGEVLAGLAVAHLPTEAPAQSGGFGVVVLGGVGSVAIAAIWSRLFPALRDRDRLV